MLRNDTEITFGTDGQVKPSHQGQTNPYVTIREFPPNKELHPVAACIFKMDKKLEREYKNLVFLNFIKPYGPVLKATITRWLTSLRFDKKLTLASY